MTVFSLKQVCNMQYVVLFVFPITLLAYVSTLDAM